ncbi:MAG: YraN family protein [Syntrophothermus sp.]
MSENIEFGKKGEEIAADFLRKKGFKILEMNWRSGRNEVDIIAMDKEYLVIVEVKTRSSTFAGEPETAVTRDKQRGLIIAANSYLRFKQRSNEVRFDIVAIVIQKESETIHHIEDAFYPY